MPTPINPATSFPHQHNLCRTIGSGSEANVQAWTHRSLGVTMAVKIYKRPKKTLPIEVEILKALPYHDSIISILAYLPKSSTLHGDAVFLEYCPFGDLFELEYRLWQKTRGAFSEACMWSVFSQLSAAVAFLHEGIGCHDSSENRIWRPVIHRDIKIENIFVMSIGQKKDLSNIKIKLGDFGLSTFWDPANARMPGWFGTTIVWPPEQTWEGREARPAGDVWATGCVIHELAHGFPPVVDPRVTKALLETKTGRLCPTWGEQFQANFWAAKSERKPLPINLASRCHDYDVRRKRPTPRYSDRLSDCMMTALEMSMEKRPTAGELREKVEEEHAAFLFDELKVESEALQTQVRGADSEDGYDEYI